MKINNFQGELTDISAKKEALHMTAVSGPQKRSQNAHMQQEVYKTWPIYRLGQPESF